jgi:Cu-Zn family superoxide dismutase
MITLLTTTIHRLKTVSKAARKTPVAFAVNAEQKAVVVLTGTAGVAGTLTLTQDDPSGATTVVGDITGLAPGKHGLHVHEFGDTTNGCMSTGPHFNPNKMTHGAPTDSVRHAGDLGNVIADAGGCKFTIKDMQIPLSGANSIVGRAFVIHELEDDLGKGDNSEIGTQGKTSSTTGNAGARLACGVVGLTP